MRVALWAIFAGMMVATAAYAQNDIARPWEPSISDNVPVTLHEALPPHVRVGNVDIVLETTRLSDLQGLHLIGVINRVGDAAASLSWSCRDVNTVSALVRICPRSGEIDGGDSIGSVTIGQLRL